MERAERTSKLQKISEPGETVEEIFTETQSGTISTKELSKEE